MDRRTLLALGLTAVVIVATPLIFPAPRRSPALPMDSTAGVQERDTTTARIDAAPAPAPASRATIAMRASESPPTATARAETTTVRTSKAMYRIVDRGAVPASVTLPEYRSLRSSTRAALEGPVELVAPGERLFHLQLAFGSDTIALDTVRFRANPVQLQGGAIVQEFSSLSLAPPVALTYRFPADSFTFRLDARIASPRAAGGSLLVTFPSRIPSEEADVQDDTRHLSVGYKVRSDEVTSVSFGKLDTLAARVDTGAIEWTFERNKYFVIAIAPGAASRTFESLAMRGVPRAPGASEATEARARAVLPFDSSAVALRVYAGPQAWNHMRKAFPDLENVNPYGGWLHGIVQPFSTIVMRMLLWLQQTTGLGYGWVLVIFGVAVRLLLWPLNQNAMRSSMKMQRIQPQLSELQKKYKDNPEKQREAMMKLYQEHGMSPFTPVLGCLPMLIPMPILYALYWVFQNTIELRGVSFLWLPDLSLKDPYFITPLFMGISMFALSWIGMRGMPPSPQGKMMSYVMPVMFTVLFWKFASGLNLYYAVQNVAALPQQWLIARERSANAPPPAPAPPVGGARGTARERG